MKGIPMAPKEKEPTNIDDLQRKALEQQIEIQNVQLQTAELQMEEQKEKNAAYIATKEDRSRRNKVRQAQLRSERANHEARQQKCAHRQGGQPGETFDGNGPSILTRTEAFFEGNYIIQCARCGLKMAKPHSSLRKTNPKKFQKDMELYEELLKASKTNGLQPMKTPTFNFFNTETGDAVAPAIR